VRTSSLGKVGRLGIAGLAVVTAGAGLLAPVSAAPLPTSQGGARAGSAPPAATPGSTGDRQRGSSDSVRPRQRGHELPNPLEAKRRALREQAITAVLGGKARVRDRDGSSVVRVGRTADARAVTRNGRARVGERARTARDSQAQYVELARETTDRMFVVLVEFGNKRHPKFPDKDLEPDIPGPATFAGPQRNQIPRPHRKVDNSTVWQPHYNRAHYRELYFGDTTKPGSGGEPTESVKTYYERQSSGRYSISGTVTDWVKVRYNEARYGRSSDNPKTHGNDPAVCADVVCANTWALVADAVNAWVAEQRARGLTTQQIRTRLATFDKWDRYDFDSDGDFNEPDGYLDHFQVVHAGGDEADGDPQQGEDAIWSHRWYVQTTPIGKGGPTGNPAGGTEIGKTGLWVGDYTIQPENGGMSVFAHEFGHDLGLPDLYDTAGGDNSVEWWSLMAQSRVSARGDLGLGTRAADLGAWDKLMLGWLDYALVEDPSAGARVTLGPHEFNTKNPQAAVVVLPKKDKTTKLVAPYAGARDWWSGAGDDLSTTLSREVALGSGTSTLRLRANWDIEDCGADACDYAYVEVNPGDGWVAIPGSITKPAEGNGIDGSSNGWKPATFDLSAYADSTIGLRLRYATDAAVGGLGFFADEISVTSGGQTLFTSGAEDGDEGWTLDGFRAAGTSVTEAFDNYYIASHRGYVSFDTYLRSGPYNFGFVDKRPNFVEHFPYQDGLLISYWDTSQTDNNTSEHPGHGLILPIDAHPRPIVQKHAPGKKKAWWRARVAGYDAPFSRQRADTITLHTDSEPQRITGRKARATFDDRGRYWYPQTPEAGVKVPRHGVRIEVTGDRGSTTRIAVSQR
jgi:immune inhibitor A